jgi:hypothetical protein
VKRLEEMSADYGSEVEFLASHFFEIPLTDLSELSFEVLQQVLSCEKLRIESEESIYEIVSKRISSDVRYFDLLGLIRFEFVSEDCFRQYLELVSDSFQYFTFSCWISLQSRLLLPVEWKSSNNRLAVRNFPFEPSSPLAGIIGYRTARCGGNVHECGLVNLTANRPGSENLTYSPQNVADFAIDSVFHSAN